MATGSTSEASSFEPVDASRRIVELDVLRGVALFGIALVNIFFFAHPLDIVIDPDWKPGGDRAAHLIVEFFAAGKFYPLFSLLFGIGFGIQIERMRIRGVDTAPWFLRRMLVLLCFGVGHVVIFWYGDILIPYAILGTCLLYFRDHSPPALLRSALIAFLIPIGFVALSWGFVAVSAVIPSIESSISQHAERDRAEAAIANEETTERYRGGWNDALVQRLDDFGRVFFQTLPVWPMIFAMFLAGYWTVKSGLLEHLQERRRWIVFMVSVSAIIGVPANLLSVTLDQMGDPYELSLTTALSLMFHFIGGVALCLVYAGVVVLLMRGSVAPILRWLAPAGRMALTNYLLQSALFSLLFYGYGAGLFGSIGPPGLVGIVVIVFLLEVAASAAWLKRARYGPAEWVWRALTYGRGVLRARRHGVR